jgi:hypothetical protein
VHIGAALAGVGQALPHAPQFAIEAVRSASHPFDAT